ncbi:MAG: LPS export ABC transporter ATP-binding protein [bacterium]
MTVNGGGLRALGLLKTYKGRPVVNGVDIDVKPGEIVGLLGPNGAGKTTTFYCLVGLVRPDSGTVMLGDEEITTLPMHQRARRGVGYLPQEPSVFRRLSARDNVLAILETLPLSREEREARLATLLKDFGLDRVADTQAGLLSGGEKRRVEIARALVIQPKFMLLDEPFVGIDPITVGEIQSMVAGLRARGLGVLITDHNVRETLAITDRAYLMYDGKILLHGTAQELLESDEAKKVYLGEDFRL